MLAFTDVKLRRTVQAVQITEDNMSEIAEAVDGKITNAILKFEISGYVWYALVDDWFLLYDTGDVQICTDAYYKRLFEEVPLA